MRTRRSRYEVSDCRRCIVCAVVHDLDAGHRGQVCPDWNRSDLRRSSEGIQDGRRGRLSGIPFAAPPIGDLRWRPPAPATPWVKPLDTVAFGGRCVQTNTFGVFAAPSEKEDCLYLNVFAPHRTASPSDRDHPGRQALRPVMVWIYGGGFFDGESDDYDGTGLATEGDVIVVTINYRVNVFGFLGHPALDAEGHTAVNYGLMDQQAALRWVQRNIRAFRRQSRQRDDFRRVSGRHLGSVPVGVSRRGGPVPPGDRAQPGVRRRRRRR